MITITAYNRIREQDCYRPDDFVLQSADEWTDARFDRLEEIWSGEIDRMEDLLSAATLSRKAALRLLIQPYRKRAKQAIRGLCEPDETSWRAKAQETVYQLYDEANEAVKRWMQEWTATLGMGSWLNFWIILAGTINAFFAVVLTRFGRILIAVVIAAVRLLLNRLGLFGLLIALLGSFILERAAQAAAGKAQQLLEADVDRRHSQALKAAWAWVQAQQQKGQPPPDEGQVQQLAETFARGEVPPDQEEAIALQAAQQAVEEDQPAVLGVFCEELTRRAELDLELIRIDPVMCSQKWYDEIVKLEQAASGISCPDVEGLITELWKEHDKGCLV